MNNNIKKSISTRNESIDFRCPGSIAENLNEYAKKHKLKKSDIIRKAINKFLRYKSEGKTVRLRKRKMKCTCRIPFRESNHKIEKLRECGALSPQIWRILEWYFKMMKDA